VRSLFPQLGTRVLPHIDGTTRHRPIRTRILAGLGGVVASALVIIVAFLMLLNSVAASFANGSTHVLALTQAERSLSDALVTEQSAVLEYQVTPSPAAADRINALHAEQTVALQRLGVLGSEDPALSQLVDSVAREAGAWRTGWADPVVLRAGNGPLPEGFDLSPSNGARLFTDVRLALQALEDGIAAHSAGDITGPVDKTRLIATAAAVGGVVLCLIVLGIGFWLVRVVTTPLGRLSQTALDQLAGKEDVRFHIEGDNEIGALSRALERLRVDVAGRYELAREEGRRAATLNQLGDLISFSTSEADLVNATVRALGRLAPTPRGDVQLANASRNRLIWAGTWGPDEPPLDTPVPVDRIDRCPGIRRTAAYVTPDVTDALAVRCPAHPMLDGGLACVPLVAMGQVVGVIHLESRPDAPFDQATVEIATRVAEQVAVAIANARLMKTMESLAMTDALTGLRNARFFDSYLEQELAAAARDEQPLALLILDIDHFKQFNDTHGHPSGDEALRAFGRVLRSSIRSSDVAARYGGEEFIVALHNTGLDGAIVTAEKIRTAVEQTVVEIGPGRYARVTVSVGAVATDVHLVDQKGLIALADAALYRAKEGGRNRIETGPTSEGDVQAAAGRRAGRARRDQQPADATAPVPLLGARGIRTARGA